MPDARFARIEVGAVDDFPASVDEVLRDFKDPPLQFQRRESALAAAVLLALEIWDENTVSQTIIDCEGEEIGIGEIVVQLRRV